jgi:hypothetical protein
LNLIYFQTLQIMAIPSTGGDDPDIGKSASHVLIEVFSFPFCLAAPSASLWRPMDTKGTKNQGCDSLSGNSRNRSSAEPKLANAIRRSTASDG